MNTSEMSVSPSPEAAPGSALVIPFPVRSKAPVLRPKILQETNPTPEQRLNRALASLNSAMAEQRAAVAAWRDGLVTLKTTTSRLADSLHRYRVNLDKLNNSVSALRDNAQSLETWADGVTTTTD